MSFFTSSKTGLCPGPIQNNPLSGLCERVCIETEKVYDSCIQQIEELGLEVVMVNPTPSSPTQPLTFVSCAASTTEDTTISNLNIQRFEEAPNFARVSADVNIPITINYVDACGVEGSGETIVTVSKDVILFVPQPSIVPFEVKAFANAVCANGEYIGNNTFKLDLCITVILKVVATVDLLVPTYGYCQIPPCQEFKQEVCPKFFNLPLYPEAQSNKPSHY
jgi:hypothetical protein